MSRRSLSVQRCQAYHCRRRHSYATQPCKLLSVKLAHHFNWHATYDEPTLEQQLVHEVLSMIFVVHGRAIVNQKVVNRVGELITPASFLASAPSVLSYG